MKTKPTCHCWQALATDLAMTARHWQQTHSPKRQALEQQRQTRQIWQQFPAHRARLQQR